MHPTILEVALNGPWGPAQPGIPIRVRDIVAQGIRCARAGASIIHAHPYDQHTGRQKDQADIYCAIIEGIREQVDVIVYPSAPFDGHDTPARFAVTEELARRGLLEWATVDPGSANIARFDEIAAGADGFAYVNSAATIRAGLALAARYGFRPAYACYEPGFVRLGAALHAQLTPATTRSAAPAPTPIYRLMFSDQFAFGFAPTDAALAAYAELLATAAPGAPVMVSGLGVDIVPLIPVAVARGFHVRVGLEDAPLGTTHTNEWLTEHAVDVIERAGGRLGNIADARAL